MKISLIKKGTFLIFSLLLFTPQVIYSSEIFSTQAGAFSSEKNAQGLVNDLKKYSINCIVQETEGMHKVYCGKFSRKSDAYALKIKLSYLGYKGAFIVSRSPQPSQETIKLDRLTKQFLQREVVPPLKEKTPEKFQEPIQERDTKPIDTKDLTVTEEEIIKPKEVTDRKEMPVAKEKTTLRDVTVPQEKVTEPADVTSAQKRISEDIFEKRGGFLHPFLSIDGYYTDNVFNTRDKKYDYIAIISPGLWVSLPRIKQQLLEIETSTITPGGFKFSRMGPEFFRRYQTYLLYRADIEQFSRYSSENTINQIAEGLFQYNFRGGLSIEFADQFVRSHDIRGTGISKELDKFRTNLFAMMLTYDVSEKFKLKADYSHFLVNYEARRNDFRDRFDNSFSGYVFYKFLPKTAAFVEYTFINVKYNDPILSNSKEHHFFGGLQWDITAKSRGRVKAGYGAKNFIDSDLGDNKEFILEAQIDHDFTPRTSLRLTALRKTNETNIPTTYFILSNSLELEYRHRLTSKISGSLKFLYAIDTYEGNLTFGGATKEREDDYFGAGLALQYEFKRWLKVDAGYLYNRRDSSFSEFDYTNNTVFIRVTGSL